MPRRQGPGAERIPYRHLRDPALLQLLDLLREGRQGARPIEGSLRREKELFAPREPLRPQIHQQKRQRPAQVFFSRAAHQGLARASSIN